MQGENRPYRLGVGIILVNSSSQVFVGQRVDTDHQAWQMPQGGIEDGEDPQDAALRELWEETGINKVKIIAEAANWISYDLPEQLSRSIWGGRYRGQKQKWYVMYFTGCDRDIDITCAESPEFSVWKWIDPDTVISHAIFFKRDLYRKVMDNFRDVILTYKNP